MRTTLSLDPDIAERLQQEMRRTGSGLKATVNAALRRGLSGGSALPRPRRFRIVAQKMELRPGFDADRMNQLYDSLETTDLVAKLARP